MCVRRSRISAGLTNGERVVCRDVPHLHGTVTRCDEDGVQVQWDDGRIGELIWDDTVAYNAYRLDILRPAVEPIR